jgi:hypothetical protein
MAIVSCTDSFAAANGVRVQGGALFDADHPIVRRYPSMFATPPFVTIPRTAPPVEQATAAPGETRVTKRPTKRASKPAS